MKKFVVIILMLTVLLSCISCRKPVVAQNKLPLGTYICNAAEELRRPNVTLLENNRFSFVFSLFSSYTGWGEYEVSDSTLLLKTEDGQFHYTFAISNNELIFDAENSSESLWSGDFSDCSIFRLSSQAPEE